MDEALKKHVESLLKEAGHNPTSASREAGLNVHFVRQWLSGRVRSPGADQLRRVAEVLGVTLDELTKTATPRGTSDVRWSEFETEPPARRAPSGGPILPARYIVQAGVWAEVDEQRQAGLLGPPVAADARYPKSAQWLELVRGDSIDKVYPDGAWIHVVDAVAIGYAPSSDDFVVVERKRHQGGLIERTVKQVAKKRGRIELWPRSNNPKWKEPIALSTTEDDTIVEIAALVIGGYLPARR